MFLLASSGRNTAVPLARSQSEADFSRTKRYEERGKETGMSLRPPQRLRLHDREVATDVLEYEILQEKASTLGRLTEAFARALAAFQAFEYPAADNGLEAASGAQREALLRAAGDALFEFVIQREACGLRNTDAVLRELRVPASVRLRMGVTRPKP